MMNDSKYSQDSIETSHNGCSDVADDHECLANAMNNISLTSAESPNAEGGCKTDVIGSRDDLMQLGTPVEFAAPTPATCVLAAKSAADQLLTVTPNLHPARRMMVEETPRRAPESSRGNTIPDKMYTESDVAQLKREIQLRYEDEWLRKQKEMTARLSVLNKEKQQLTRSTQQMKERVLQLEAVVTEKLASKEETNSEALKRQEQLQRKNDALRQQIEQASDDCRSVESAFGDLQKRYEKSRDTIISYEKNEDELRKEVQELGENLESERNKLSSLQQQATQRVQESYDELSRVKSSSESDAMRRRTALRKANLEIDELRTTVEQKIKANEDLSAICDELLAKSGVSS